MTEPDETTYERSIADAAASAERWRTQAVPLLILAMTAADAVFLTAAEGQDFPALPLVIAYALIFSQISLAAIWAGLICRNLILAALGLAMTYAVALAPLIMLHENEGAWGRVVVIQMAAVALPLLAARAIGLRLSRDTAYRGHGKFQFTRVQFTLRRLFAVMTSLAIFLAIGRVVAERLPPMQFWADAPILGGGFAVIALLATWASLGVGRLRLRLAVLGVGSLAIGWVVTRLVPPTPKDVAGVFGIVAGDCCLLAASLAVLRRQGYRLVRQSAVN